MLSSIWRARHPGENRGSIPIPLTWIPFSNGMTDTWIPAGVILSSRRAGMTNFRFA